MNFFSTLGLDPSRFQGPQMQQPVAQAPQNVFAARAGMPPQGMPQPQPGMPQIPQAPNMPFQGGMHFGGPPMSGAMPANPGVRPMMPPAAPQMSQAAIPQPQNFLRMRLGM